MRKRNKNRLPKKQRRYQAVLKKIDTAMAQEANDASKLINSQPEQGGDDDAFYNKYVIPNETVCIGDLD